MTGPVVVASDPAVLVVRDPAREVVAVADGSVVVVWDPAPSVLQVEVLAAVAVAAPGPQGPAGPAGLPGGAVETVLAGDVVQAHRVVVLGDGALARHAQRGDLGDAARVFGVAEHAALPGENLRVRLSGLLAAPGAAWPPGPLFAGDDGALTAAPPAAGWHMQIATAVTDDTLIIRPEPPIYR